MNNENEVDEVAVKLLKVLEDETSSIWKVESKYRRYRCLQIDKKGSFGKRFFAQVLLTFNRRIEYNDGDQGDWDLKINGIKFEVKTSSVDVNNKFQNEGIKENGDYDGILFLCIKPDDLFIKFVKKEDIPFDKLHDRKGAGTGSGYKWDFKEEDLIKIKTIKDVQNEFEKVFK